MGNAALKLSPTDLDLIFGHADVPPLDFPLFAVLVPAAPKLAKILKTATPKYLRRLYTSAAKLYWPLQEAKKRSVSTDSVLLAVAQTLSDLDVSPAAYLQWVFRRAVDGSRRRLSPLDSQVVFDPAGIREALEGARLGQALSMPTVHRDPYLLDLAEVTRVLHRRLRAIPRYDTNTIAAIAAEAFPRGWEAEYQFAAEYCKDLQARLDAAVAKGLYVWGK